MFRDDVPTLAGDLTEFIHEVVHGRGVVVRAHGNRYRVNINPHGSVSDITLLCSSPQELDSQDRPRLPLLLRDELNHLSPPIRVFNPRGQSLSEIQDVQRLCGLILECIDPDSTVEDSIRKLPRVARATFDNWRRYAQAFIRSNPNPRTPYSLRHFVDAWQNRTLLGVRRRPRMAPLIDLVYKLVTWITNMQNDIEGVVYLEAMTRTIIQSALFSRFRSEIVFERSDPDSRASIEDAIWKIFVPLGTGAIEVNEELLETLPPDRINVMSVHQAKGLEFPLVIVDVGSDFREDHHQQAFKRFPTGGGIPHRMEDEFRGYCPIGPPTRSALDRAFDDLIRQYFVAYSRAQDVLLLVGLNSVRDFVQHIATGWDRLGHWHLGRGLHDLVHI